MHVSSRDIFEEGIANVHHPRREIENRRDAHGEERCEGSEDAKYLFQIALSWPLSRSLLRPGWTKLSAPHRALLIQSFIDSVPTLLKLQGVFWRVGNLVEVVIVNEGQSFGVFGITQESFMFVAVVVHKILFY